MYHINSKHKFQAMKQQTISGFNSGQMAVLRLLRTATKQAADLMAAGTLVTCASFHNIILRIRPLAGLRVISFSLIETSVEFPAVSVFVTFSSDLYHCTFFLFPVEEERGKYIPVRIDVTIDRHPEKYPFPGSASGILA